MTKNTSESNQLAANHQKAVRVAVVGHTNTGKTSLIRTLLRDERFGNIEDAAGTTRYVEKTAIFAGENEALTLFDTPGFEDSSALLQALEELEKAHKAGSPSLLLREFIEKADQFPEFDQEIKVLRQSLNCDVLLYIIDVREPLLGKYRDEVEILSKAGKPIIPVFNFIAGQGAALTRWREQMSQFNLHAALEFDTVAFAFEAEKRLYQKLQSLLEKHYETLQALIDYRQEVWQKLNQAAAQRIFQLITEVACYRQEVADQEITKRGTVSSAKVDAMHAFVRKTERRTVKDLLKIFAFSQVDIDLQQIAVHDGVWELDIFAPGALKEFGLSAGAAALKGAAAGAGVDLMVGGLSMGAGAVLGGILGAGWATARHYKQELGAAWRGNKWLCVGDTTISLLYLRQRELLHTLTQRGHAAQHKLQVSSDMPHTLPKRWPKVIKVLRQHPAWQRAAVTDAATDAEYQSLQTEVVGWLLAEE